MVKFCRIVHEHLFEKIRFRRYLCKKIKQLYSIVLSKGGVRKIAAPDDSIWSGLEQCSCHRNNILIIRVKRDAVSCCELNPAKALTV